MGQFGCPDWVCCCPGRFDAASWKTEGWKEQPLNTDECPGENSAKFSTCQSQCLLLPPLPSVPDIMVASGIHILRDANPSDLYPKLDQTAKTSRHEPDLRSLRFCVYRYISAYLCAYIAHKTCGFLQGKNQTRLYSSSHLVVGDEIF